MFSNETMIYQILYVTPIKHCANNLTYPTFINFCLLPSEVRALGVSRSNDVIDTDRFNTRRLRALHGQRACSRSHVTSSEPHCVTHRYLHTSPLTSTLYQSSFQYKTLLSSYRTMCIRSALKSTNRE